MHLVRSRRPHGIRGLDRGCVGGGCIDDGGGASVGLDVFGESAGQHAVRSLSAINATQKQFEAVAKRMHADAVARAGSPSAPSCTVTGGDPSVGCYTQNEIVINTFFTDEWDPFYKRAYAVLGSVGNYGSWEEKEMEIYDKEHKTLRSRYETLSGATLPALVTPLPTEEEKPSTVNRLATSIENIVTIAGIGVGLYLVGEFIVPMLAGAAKKSKEAHRSYRGEPA